MMNNGLLLSDKLLISGIVIFVLLVLFGFVYLAWDESQKPTIELKKSEWECTGTRSEPHTYYIQSGKIMTPVTINADVCVEYKKR